MYNNSMSASGCRVNRDTSSMGAMKASDEGMATWTAFVRAHAALFDVLEAELQDRRDLPITWYDVLVTLSRVPKGQMRMQDLAREVLLSKSGLTRLFDRMEHAGLVERQSCPSDRRGTLAVMTPEGRRELQRARPVHHRGIEEHFLAHVTAEEAEAMREGFERILRALGRSAEPCDSEDAVPEASAAIG
jgi:DNA-binding MarR family transcriptional regulator